jgi:hypothetical protein
VREETAGDAEADVDEVVRTWAPKLELELEPEVAVAAAAPDRWGNEPVTVPVARAAAGNDMAAAMALAMAALVDLGAAAEEAEAATGMGD